MKKHATKIVSLTLVLLMLLGCFAACKKDDAGSADSESKTGGEIVQGSDVGSQDASDSLQNGLALDENGYVKDTLPETYDFNGKDFTILQWDNSRHEFISQDEAAANMVNRAKFDSQARVEKRFNVKFNVLLEPGDWDHRVSFMERLGASVAVGSGTYDLVCEYSSAAGIGAYNGYLRDIRSLEYVNLEMPWWPQHLLSSATIGENVYYCAGDINAETQIAYMYAHFVNLDMYDQYKIADLVDGRSIFEVVDDGDWTLETFTRMAIGTTGNDVSTVGFTWGNDTFVDAYLYAGGFNAVKTTNGTLSLDPSLSSSKMSTWLENCQKLFSDIAHPSDVAGRSDAFEQGLSLFTGDYAAKAEALSADGVVDFSILPIPKYDKDQEHFYSCMGLYSTLISVPNDIKDETMTGMILEGLASQAHRTVKDVVYYDIFQTRYAAAKDSDGARMFDLAYNSVTFDVARVFSAQFNVWGVFRGAAYNSANTWSSIYAAQSEDWKIATSELYAKLG